LNYIDSIDGFYYMSRTWQKYCFMYFRKRSLLRGLIKNIAIWDGFKRITQIKIREIREILLNPW